MGKAAKLYALLGVLLVICAAAFAVSRHENKKEQIRTSGDAILEIPTETVTKLAWTNKSGSFSFSRGENWTYDADEAFPVDSEKLEALLTQFQTFRAAFSIENVEDFTQYGLDDPVGTVSITAGDQTYTLTLGSFSKMDQQRYLTLGNGSVHLAEHDPLEEFDAVADDLILNDTVPQFDTAEEISFVGIETYTVTRNEEKASICQDDIYFTDDAPLDTSLVNSYLTTLKGLSLTDYVTYNVSEEQLHAYGLDAPTLTVAINYSRDTAGSFQLHLTQDPLELQAYEEAKEKEETNLPTVTCYARLNDSQIVYEISQSTYDKLTAVSYNTLRHQKLFTADFSSVTAVDVTLNGEAYTFTYQPAEEKDTDGIWLYNGSEIAIYNLRTGLCSMSATEFTEGAPDGQEEISVTVHLDNEAFPTFTLTLYRHNGTTCLASVNGEAIALVSRSQAVDLIEAINEIILGE